MTRIELLMSVFAGACGGLVGVLWNGTVTSAWLRASDATAPLAVDGERLGALLAGAAGHAGAGAVQGVLFWASWSLIALVDVPWYLTGVAFGLLCWGGAALPAMLSLRLRSHMPVRLAYAAAAEWFASCVAAGLFCAYSWQRFV